jgi:hypothetical protein
MTPLELLAELRERGVKLWVEGADLRFSGPKGMLASPARGLLARHKVELMRLFESRVGAQLSAGIARFFSRQAGDRPFVAAQLARR